jgi:hypothetical protein
MEINECEYRTRKKKYKDIIFFRRGAIVAYFSDAPTRHRILANCMSSYQCSFPLVDFMRLTIPELPWAFETLAETTHRIVRNEYWDQSDEVIDASWISVMAFLYYVNNENVGNRDVPLSEGDIRRVFERTTKITCIKLCVNEDPSHPSNVSGVEETVLIISRSITTYLVSYYLCYYGIAQPRNDDGELRHPFVSGALQVDCARVIPPAKGYSRGRALAAARLELNSTVLARWRTLRDRLKKFTQERKLLETDMGDSDVDGLVAKMLYLSLDAFHEGVRDELRELLRGTGMASDLVSNVLDGTDPVYPKETVIIETLRLYEEAFRIGYSSVAGREC